MINTLQKGVNAFCSVSLLCSVDEAGDIGFHNLIGFGRGIAHVTIRLKLISDERELLLELCVTDFITGVIRLIILSKR